MTNVEWVLVPATLMTSERVPAYGGIRFPREALQAQGDRINAEGIPMQMDHDATRPLRVRNVRAWVDPESTSGGHDRLQLEYEMHPDDWASIGNRLGMSASMFVPLPDRSLSDLRDDPGGVSLAGDHAWFSDSQLVAAEANLLDLGLEYVNTERLYQFSFTPDPQIFLEVVLPLAQRLSLGVLGNAVWDGIKWLLGRRQTPPGGDPSTPTRLNVTARDGDRSLTWVMETSESDVAEAAITDWKAAIESFMDRGTSTPPSKKLLVWDPVEREWREHGTPSSDA